MPTGLEGSREVVDAADSACSCGAQSVWPNALRLWSIYQLRQILAMLRAAVLN